MQELYNALSALSGRPVDAVAPSGVERFIVAAQYGASSAYGADANVLDIPRVQIDIYTPDPEDPLPDRVMSLLQAWHMPYTVIGRNIYEEDRNVLRTILQLEVIA